MKVVIINYNNYNLLMAAGRFGGFSLGKRKDDSSSYPYSYGGSSYDDGGNKRKYYKTEDE